MARSLTIDIACVCMYLESIRGWCQYHSWRTLLRTVKTSWCPPAYRAEAGWSPSPNLRREKRQEGCSNRGFQNWIYSLNLLKLTNFACSFDQLRSNCSLNTLCFNLTSSSVDQTAVPFHQFREQKIQFLKPWLPVAYDWQEGGVEGEIMVTLGMG